MSAHYDDRWWDAPRLRCASTPRGLSVQVVSVRDRGYGALRCVRELSAGAPSDLRAAAARRRIRLVRLRGHHAVA